MGLEGLGFFAVYFATMASIYAIIALGLNIQWGMTGQINIGVGGFFGVGAYTSALLVAPESSAHLGGFDLPFLVGVVGAVAVAGAIALVIGRICADLRTDYLAIATIGIAEIIRLAATNEDWLTGGPRGLADIPRPDLSALGSPFFARLDYLIIVLVFLTLTFFLAERARRAPWGRVLRAVRDNEAAVKAAGKDVARFRLEGFVVGSMMMGLGGALYGHFFGFLSPEALQPLLATFLIWAMLITGGSGNNWGAILGAFALWAVWSGSELAISQLGLDEVLPRPSAWRILLVGLLVQVILLTRPQGLLPEPKPRGDELSRH